MPLQAIEDVVEGVEPEAARRLLVAGIQTFAALGYHATSTREIAARAGMSPAALYVHYESKTRLLEEIIVRGHQSALRAFEQGLGVAAEPAGRIAGAVREFTRWHAANKLLARVVQYELEALPPRERREVGALRTQVEAELCHEIERGIVSGEFAPADVQGTATAIFSLCIDVARWYPRRRSGPPGDIGELYGQLVLRMLRCNIHEDGATGSAIAADLA